MGRSLAVLVHVSLFFAVSYSSTFLISNNCPYTIWPGTLAGSGTQQLPTTGFRLDAGQSVRIPSVPGWSGRIWGRTGCSFDTSGVGKCLTGDCGGRLECDGSGATPPASLFEITLGGSDNKDFYDVSLVDGYNLPMVALPTRGAVGACNATGCVADLNLGCPKELQVVGEEDEGGVVACKSACEAFGSDQYCCSGQFANPNTCRPTFYSTVFKKACPRAYSYAFDDGTSTFTCTASEYAIIFCPVSNRIKRPNSQFSAPPAQGGNGQFMPPPGPSTATPTQNPSGQYMAPPTPSTAAPTQNPSGQYMAPPTPNTATPIPNPSGQYVAPPTPNTGTPIQSPSGQYVAPPTPTTATTVQNPSGQYMNPPTQNQNQEGPYMVPPRQNGGKASENGNGGMGRVVEMPSSSLFLRPLRFSLLLFLPLFAF